MSHLNQNKKILNRIRRIQGQTNALEQNILNSENSCIEVLRKRPLSPTFSNSLIPR